MGYFILYENLYGFQAAIFSFFSGLYNLYEGGFVSSKGWELFLITGGGQKGRTYMFGRERNSRI